MWCEVISIQHTVSSSSHYKSIWSKKRYGSLQDGMTELGSKNIAKFGLTVEMGR